MERKRIVSIIIVVAIIAVIVCMAVLTFVDFDSFKKKEFTVKYEATAGGNVKGNTKQIIQEGKSSETVKAVPDEGYRFLKWSDTCNPDPVRTDVDVTENISSKAVFLKVSDIEYKILLVFVTEVQATFMTHDGVEVVADHKLDEQELQLCHMITQQFDVYLNEMFDGLVNFVIDEYFTHEVVKKENFDNNVGELTIFAENIPEVVPLLTDYENYITTCYLTDINHVLCVGAGSANYKTATIPLQEHIGPYPKYFEEYPTRTPKFLENYRSMYWDNLIATYLHEFTHTVEQGFAVSVNAPFHYVLAEYSNGGGLTGRGSLDVTRLYLLNQAQYNNETVGIPFPAWTKEVYTLRYNADDELLGFITGNLLPNHAMPLRVAKGYDSEEITAVPFSNYKFVKWSDGVTTATRIDKNIQKDMEIIAYFEPREFTVKYLTSDGGKIVGKATQQCVGAASFEAVTAVAEEGYRFVRWSDGKTSATRTDSTYGITDVERYDENDYLELTAIFERVS